MCPHLWILLVPSESLIIRGLGVHICLRCSTKFKEWNPLGISLGGVKQVEVSASVSLGGVCDHLTQALTFTYQPFHLNFCINGIVEALRPFPTSASLHLVFALPAISLRPPPSPGPQLLRITRSFKSLSSRLNNHLFRKAFPDHLHEVSPIILCHSILLEFFSSICHISGYLAYLFYLKLLLWLTFRFMYLPYLLDIYTFI